MSGLRAHRDPENSPHALAIRDYTEIILGKLRGRKKSKGVGTHKVRFHEAQTRFAEPDAATLERWRSAWGDADVGSRKTRRSPS